MSHSLDLLSLILVITLSQGFFILSLLVLKNRLAELQHKFLFVIVLVLMWFQGEFLSVRIPVDIQFNLFYGTRYGAWLILGPLFYHYVLSVAGKGKEASWAAMIHAVPFITFVFVIPLLTGEFLSFRQINYGMLTAFDSFNEGVTVVQYIYSVVFAGQFVHMLVYLIVSQNTIKHYESNLKDNYSNFNSANLLWLKVFNLLLLLILILVTSFLALFFMTRSYDRNNDYMYVIPLVLFTYFVSYKMAGVKWPAEVLPEGRSIKYEKSSLKDDQSIVYAGRLNALIASEKPYLNNELRLQDLAGMLNIPVHHLSQVINEHLNTTFFDYINRLRVEEAKRLIENGKNETLLDIGFSAGFNNKTSFVNAFKKFTSQTPAEFRRLARSNKKKF